MLKYLSYKTRGLNHYISKIALSRFLLMAGTLALFLWCCMPSDSAESTWRVSQLPSLCSVFMWWRELFHLLHHSNIYQIIVFMHFSLSAIIFLHFPVIMFLQFL